MTIIIKKPVAVDMHDLRLNLIDAARAIEINESTKKLKIALFDFTGCVGCQLQLAESKLMDFPELLEISHFRVLSSYSNDDYDIALIEGCISCQDEVERLQKIRQHAKLLVAVGICACFGGISTQVNKCNLDETIRDLYNVMPVEGQSARRISDVVKVDHYISGCPTVKEELELMILSFVLGRQVIYPNYSVCVECRQQLNTCLCKLGGLCLGSLTRAGCNAACPTGGSVCLGCRGPAAKHNMPVFLERMKKKGLNHNRMFQKLAFYNAFEPLVANEA